MVECDLHAIGDRREADARAGSVMHNVEVLHEHIAQHCANARHSSHSQTVLAVGVKEVGLRTCGQRDGGALLAGKVEIQRLTSPSNR
jgi:hypothetical protein